MTTGSTFTVLYWNCLSRWSNCKSCVSKFHRKYRQNEQPCMITFFAIIQSSVISDHSVFSSISQKGLTCTWHGKKERNYSEMNHTAIKIYIVEKLHVTVLHPTLIRHPKLIKEVLFRCVQAIIFHLESYVKYKFPCLIITVCQKQ